MGYDNQSRLLWRIIQTYNASTSTWTTTSVRHYVWDGGNLDDILDGSNQLLEHFIYGPTGLLGETDFPADPNNPNPSAGPTTYVDIKDASNDVLELINTKTGTVDADYHYGAFGENATANGPAASIGPIEFAGGLADPVTGMFYFLNRWYNPALRRFMSEDPSGLNGGTNPFSYAGDDPINKDDPTGLSVVRSGQKTYVEALQAAANDMGMTGVDLQTLAATYDKGGEFAGKTDWYFKKKISYLSHQGVIVVNDPSIYMRIADPDNANTVLQLGIDGKMWFSGDTLNVPTGKEPTAFEMAAPMLPGLGGMKGMQAVVAAYALLESYKIPKEVSEGLSAGQIAQSAATDAVAATIIHTASVGLNYGGSQMLAAFGAMKGVEVGGAAGFEPLPLNAVETEVASAYPEGMGAYKDVSGHHPLSGKAFDYKNYDESLAIGKDYMIENGWGHSQPLTSLQQQGYIAFGKTGEPLTITRMSQIEIDAMKQLGVPSAYAEEAVSAALWQRLGQGNITPTYIPWVGNNPGVP